MLQKINVGLWFAAAFFFTLFFEGMCAHERAQWATTGIAMFLFLTILSLLTLCMAVLSVYLIHKYIKKLW